MFLKSDTYQCTACLIKKNIAIGENDRYTIWLSLLILSDCLFPRQQVGSIDIPCLRFSFDYSSRLTGQGSTQITAYYIRQPYLTRSKLYSPELPALRPPLVQCHVRWSSSPPLIINGYWLEKWVIWVMGNELEKTLALMYSVPVGFFTYGVLWHKLVCASQRLLNARFCACSQLIFITNIER